MDSTRIFCVPVKRDPFQYDGFELQVNRIPRCPCQDLYALLTWVDKGPVLKKNGKPRVHQPPPHKDKDPDFYHAQCIHYGIRPFKTRPAAKRALLEAFAAQSNHLAIPQSILDTEAELKKEFAQANKAAKEQLDAEKRERQAQMATKQMKRKREQDSTIEEVSGKSAKRAKQKPLDPQAISGSFTVAAPSLSEGYGSSDEDTYIIRLAPVGSQSDTIYGEFDFGAFVGYLRSTSLNKHARIIDFNWRGRETGEGESTFGPENTFQLKFSDDGSFEGHAQGDCFRRCEIYGKRTARTGQGGKSSATAATWKYQYDALDEANYERESVARWH
ncbi:hypothetical protein LTR70_001592 [Exophiala xenobiotica]|uniref:Uncharacterized protein n=1 Tax=Lithohypha guttulata TaxID=1690604 RepID=A0ABR0K6U4_9EURO|nr:hypothetical protein LTR24_006165 [Lithohypha guttulata]KAK5327118.1 hypothetical protein LTR70_001592 [Exophiala xenobiotica]